MKLTIITATYNCEDFISSCLESVATQSAIENIEHIIVDGGSSDATLSKVSMFPHVKKIYSGPDRGIYHAFNRGVELADGDIIYFLGADDTLYDQSSIESVLSAFSDNTIDYVSTRVRCFNDDTGEVWLTNSNENDGSSICHQGFFCKASLFEKIGPFSECFKLCADSFFMKKAIQSVDGICLDIVSANFRQGGASSSSLSRQQLQQEQSAVAMLTSERSSNVEYQLDKNVNDLKSLLQKSLRKEELQTKYSNKKVGIFGTRQLSLSIAEILLSVGAKIECFITSKPSSESELNDIPVRTLSNVDATCLCLVINSIEGAHEDEVSGLIKEAMNHIQVLSWREL